MNKKRRGDLKVAESYLDMAVDIIEGALDEEEDCYDNMPENLQDSDNCYKMEDAIRYMEGALDCIEKASKKISKAIS